MNAHIIAQKRNNKRQTRDGGKKLQFIIQAAAQKRQQIESYAAESISGRRMFFDN